MKQVKLFSGLGRTLGVYFLLFALLPLTIVSIVSYNRAHKTLNAQVEKNLEIVAELKARAIHTYFNTLIAQLSFQSKTTANSKLLSRMTKAYVISGKKLNAFVRSDTWTVIADELAKDVNKYRRSFDHHDIFIISNIGDLLYSVAGEDDLGTNLFTGRFKTTKFAKAVKKTIETGQIIFSDYEKYSPSDNKIYGFLSAPVMDEFGVRTGAIAFQFSVNHLNMLLHSDNLQDSSEEIYIIGKDLKLRSEFFGDIQGSVLTQTIKTAQAELINMEINNQESNRHVAVKSFIYNGPSGKRVLGIHHELKIKNILLFIISEINEDEAFADIFYLKKIMTVFVFLTLIVTVIFVPFMVKRVVSPILILLEGTQKAATGDYSIPVAVKADNEIGELAKAFTAMLAALRKNVEDNKLRNWFQQGQVNLNIAIRGLQDISQLCSKIVSFLANYIEADMGAFYLFKNDQLLNFTAGYAFAIDDTDENFLSQFKLGQGLIGQAALDQKPVVLNQAPQNYLHIKSALGEAKPSYILVYPFVMNNKVVAVAEFAGFKNFSGKAVEFLNLVSRSICVVLENILSNTRIKNLLEESRTQTEELESNQEELRQTNETLNKQSSELQEQTALLEEQKHNLDRQNVELERSKNDLEQKAKDLELSGKYKSQFLANMSHELRTPLNSILLLSRFLAENRENTLTQKQVECADTVHSSGNELLELINEILDLAKVEAGQITLEPEPVPFIDITRAMERNFKEIAREKGISFKTDIDNNLSDTITTDYQRLNQILNNLLSNAVKFTEKGHVLLKISSTPSNNSYFATLKTIKNPVFFKVEDTGVGIPKEKHGTVFQAFKQADGSTSRKYGGTGLGLSISKEFAQLLGGELILESEPDKGSVFTLIIPNTFKKIEANLPDLESGQKSNHELYQNSNQNLNRAKEQKIVDNPETQEYVPDDRKIITKESRSILVIEDDPVFAAILRDAAREKNFKVIVADSGETGLYYTQYYSPDGIILDLSLPGMDGKTVLSRLKADLATRHIPVQIISGTPKSIDTLHMGAVDFLEKPVSMETLDYAFDRIESIISDKIKTILIVEDDKAILEMLTELLADKQIETLTASTGKKAIRLLKENDFHCMILDLGLPDMTGFELLKEIKKTDMIEMPVIIHTARDLTSEERTDIDRFSRKIILKDVNSKEKILDETLLFLHSVEADLPEAKRQIIKKIHDREAIFKDKKILIVDDDMRNVFALINILEEKGLITIAAENGQKALEQLRKNSDTNLVLMDIMMPEMDGYTAMKKIREMEPKICKVPVIALTAKAMKGDRAKCIKAGANDYLSKPVDTEKLLSMLRVWLY
jgi:CheY-like chemotaxis protein/signal transduction histidine kinase/HAMP domain-containing protein